jgi:phenylalanyl-tRNA synthetase beta chain
MPTLSARKSIVERMLARRHTDAEFSDLLFNFGLELDDIHVEDGEMVYKIDIPANRYDLLCTEGLCHALQAFTGERMYEDIETEDIGLVVHQEDTGERPYIACAVIRDLDLSDRETYDSFIEFQDKLHLTIGRNRALVSMGTHDLDAISAPIFYRSKLPEEIRFVPLNGSTEISGDKLREYFASDRKISKYLKLIEEDERYMYFEDINGEVLSLPPIINSNATKISAGTRNVLVDVTGKNFHRVNTSLKLVLSCFRGSRICSVRIIRDGEELVTPVMHRTRFDVTAREINDSLGLGLSAEQVRRCLERMMHRVEVRDTVLSVFVPEARPDVLHVCDLIEDVAIAYGYNNFERRIPDIFTTGSEEPLNKFSDKLRLELSTMGFNEVLTLTLLSKHENVFDSGSAVTLMNPKSLEYEVARTSLLPGLLKTIASNLHAKAPFKVYEVSDVVLLDPANSCGARNCRRVAAVYAGSASHLEEVQGPVSFMLEKCGILNYRYVMRDDPDRYLSKQGAAIVVDDAVVGSVGVCSPEVCGLYKVPFAASSFEIDVEKLYKIYASR